MTAHRLTHLASARYRATRLRKEGTLNWHSPQGTLNANTHQFPTKCISSPSSLYLPWPSPPPPPPRPSPTDTRSTVTAGEAPGTSWRAGKTSLSTARATAATVTTSSPPGSGLVSWRRDNINVLKEPMVCLVLFLLYGGQCKIW